VKSEKHFLAWKRGVESGAWKMGACVRAFAGAELLTAYGAGVRART
jgi:hypothetical protein